MPKPVCWHFRKKGSCAHGDACIFSHDVLDHIARSGVSLADPSAESSDSQQKSPLLYWLARMPHDATEYALLVGTLEAHGFRQAETPEQKARAVLLWCGSSTITQITNPKCVKSRLGCGTCITHKDRLALSLRRGRQTRIAPLTFKLPNERAKLLRHCRRRKEEQQTGIATWIVKPFNTGRGRGIYVTQDVEQVIPEQRCVVCQYVPNPLLVDGRKLDMRLYVLAVSARGADGLPYRKVYISRAGYVRFAKKKFSLGDLRSGKGECDADSSNSDNSAIITSTDDKAAGVNGSWDPYVHLTYVNSVDAAVHRVQRSKEWTVQQLLAHIAADPVYGQQRADELWRAIQQLALRTVNCLPPPASAAGTTETAPAAVGAAGAAAGAAGAAAAAAAPAAAAAAAPAAPPQAPPSSSTSSSTSEREDEGTTFEFFGFDVLPDADLRPWLLEVNSQPHLGSAGKAGGRIYEAEHEAKGNSIAATLTVVMNAADCTDEELDRLAEEGGLERLVEDDTVGKEWWDCGDEDDEDDDDEKQEEQEEEQEKQEEQEEQEDQEERAGESGSALSSSALTGRGGAARQAGEKAGEKDGELMSEVEYDVGSLRLRVALPVDRDQNTHGFLVGRKAGALRCKKGVWEAASLLADWIWTNAQSQPAGGQQEPEQQKGQEQQNDGEGSQEVSLVSGFAYSDHVSFDFNGKTVLELGAGVGVPSLVLASLAKEEGRVGPQRVLLTDCVTPMLDTLNRSLQANGLTEVAEVRRCDWRQVETAVCAKAKAAAADAVSKTQAAEGGSADQARPVPAKQEDGQQQQQQKKQKKPRPIGSLAPQADVIIFSEVVYNRQSAKLIPLVCRECLREAATNARDESGQCGDSRAGYVIAAVTTQGVRHSGEVPKLLALLRESMAAEGFVDAPGPVHFKQEAIRRYTEAGKNLDACVLWVWSLSLDNRL
jgi:predicted nicotinamide N-methyase